MIRTASAPCACRTAILSDALRQMSIDEENATFSSPRIADAKVPFAITSTESNRARTSSSIVRPRTVRPRTSTHARNPMRSLVRPAGAPLSLIGSLDPTITIAPTTLINSLRRASL